MGWIILGALAAVMLALVLVNSKIERTERPREPGGPWYVIELEIVWPSGPKTYRWEIGGE